MAELFYRRNQMTSSFSNLPNISEKWGWFLTLGILMFLAGALAIWLDVFTTFITVSLLGVFLMIGGVLTIAHAISARQWSGFMLNFLLGLLYLVLGFVLFQYPALGALTLTMLLAAFFMVSGFFRIVTASVLRFEHWGWFLTSGIVTLLLGVFIWMQWPASGLFILGLFIGIELLMIGTTLMSLAISARQFQHLRPV